MNSDKYDEIIDFPHFVNPNRKRMSIENRAAQFSPFAALNGYEDAIEDAERLTVKKLEISDNDAEEISRLIKLAFDNNKKIAVNFFIKDRCKEGGEYRHIEGFIKKLDFYDNLIYMRDDLRIPIGDIFSLKVKGIL